ncbi:MAG: hypothetical protein LBC43_02640 [Bifidobacteriaceae bacterium]|jgi:N utilization substance protein B|nr:hypothetical protein [Bifidobacteriaceae bacterium]
MPKIQTNLKKGSRYNARKRAMMVLYEADLKHASFNEILEQRKTLPGAQTPLPAYSVTLIEGIDCHLDEVDQAIAEKMVKRDFVKTNALDKAILRIGAYELKFSDVEREVVLQQIQLLTEAYASDTGLDFIFALLSNIQ